MTNSLNCLILIYLAGVVVCSGDHENFCRDLTDYGKLYYTKVNVTVCNTSVEKKCDVKPVSVCMEVPEIDCKVELFTKCDYKPITSRLNVSKPAMEMKSLPWCEKIEVMEDHNKTRYECHNVTKQHCTSLWKIVNGAKVWAGNDDCRDVTWEECKPTIQTVKWMVPTMNCTQELFTYLTFKNHTTDVETDEETCTVETRAVCERVQRTACGIINVRNCSQTPVTRCSEVLVPVPAKDKIHKQWCLFDQASPKLSNKDNKNDEAVVAVTARSSRSLSFDDDNEIVLSDVFNHRDRRSKDKSLSVLELNSRAD